MTLTRRDMHGLAVALSFALLAPALLTPASARAFCGFYVSGADGELFNSATMVVMMRDGTRTVLSMQNHYDGPAQDFAMIVPVPVVLEEEHVRTLPDEVFDRVDRLAAPRLVEYWETDPCNPAPTNEMLGRMAMAVESSGPVTGVDIDSLGVTVEAEFVVGEYEIVILSADDSSGLDTWLRREGYNIPAGAEPLLRPYVEQGTKFFVARVDVEEVTRVDGRLVLSPLRFDYESEEFSLPVRLGLLNAEGAQDLIVHILARRQRYETANYENVTIPTNLIVSQSVRTQFGSFYTALFDRLLEQNPNHVVTEYAWDASSCDPCPTPGLQEEELLTLGADVIGGGARGFALSRLHYRYTAEQLTEDLVFRPAGPITGGRGVPSASGELTEGVSESGTNNFQGRYVMLNPWEGAVECESPRRGVWGGPPSGGRARPTPARGLAFATRGADLSSLLGGGASGETPAADEPATEEPATEEPASAESGDSEEGSAASNETGGCGACAVGSTRSRGGHPALWILALAATLVWRRSRR